MLNHDRYSPDFSNQSNSDALSKLNNNANYNISNFNFSNEKACNDMAISKLPWLNNIRQDGRGFIFAVKSKQHRSIVFDSHDEALSIIDGLVAEGHDVFLSIRNIGLTQAVLAAKVV